MVALAFFATPALAEPMSAEAFERYTTGRTLMFHSGGQPYGAERYLPGRRVQWSFLDGECKDGTWFPQGAKICFLYEDDPDPHCWVFSKGPGGLSGVLQGDGAPVYEARDADEEMVCLGPKVGV